MASNLLSLVDGKIHITNDGFGKVSTFSPFICRADKKIICSLTGVTKSKTSLKLNDISEIDFTVSKYITNEVTHQQILNPAYKYLNSFYGIFIPEFGQYGYFRINEEPTIKAENTKKEFKTFTAYSGESILQYENLVGFLVNQGTAQSLEMYDENKDANGLPKEKIRLYNPDEPRLSLLDLILTDDYYGWTIGHVDNSIKTLSRAFSVTNSKNVYAFLMNEVAQAFRCIFDFDVIHNVINVYDIEKYGKNTNVYLSFESFVQNINVRQSGDEIYTVFNVAGDNELDISYVNFGSNKIVNLDYPLYMADPKLYRAYKAYEVYRDSLRTTYKDLFIDYTYQQTLLAAIMDRQPMDTINNNWSSKVYYKLEDLETDLGMFRAAVELIEELYTNEYGELDIEALNKSPDAAAYYSYKDVNIPNIENEIAYRTEAVGKRADAVNSDIVWEMYGLNDLLLKRETYLELIDTLAEAGYTIPWSENTDPTKTISEETWNAHYQEWQDYQGYVAELDALIAKKTEQVDEINETIDNDLAQLKEIARTATLEYFFETFADDFAEDVSDYPQIIKSFYKESDYVDSNYLITDTDDATSIVAESEQLYQAAVKRLQVESRPQLTWRTELDNLYATKDFEPLRDSLQLGDFINLVFDTERIANRFDSGIVHTEESDVIDLDDSLAGRNLLLDSKDERTTVQEENQSEGYITAYDLTTIGASVLATKGLELTISADYAVIGNADTDACICALYNGEEVYPVDNALVSENVYDNPTGVYTRTFILSDEQLESQSQSITFKMYYATTDAELSVSNVKLEVGDTATGWTIAPEETDGIGGFVGEFVELENHTFIGENYRFRVSKIEFDNIDYSDFSITFEDLIKTRAGFSDVETILDSFVSSKSNQIRVDAVSNASSVASEVAHSLIKPYLQVTNAAIENAQITNAQIEDLVATNARIETLLVNYLEANSATIFDLVTDNLTVNKTLTLVSDNDGSIVLDNSKLKFLDAHGDIRMIVGKNQSNAYDVEIYSAADGNGNQKLLWNTVSGVQSDAIADNLINTSMIGNSAVTKTKIDWTGISDSVDSSGAPIFNSNQITVNGNSLTAQWGAMQSVTDGLSSRVADVNVSADRVLMVVSQSVNNLQNSGVQGVYDATESYGLGDVVVLNGEFYMAIAPTTGNQPPNDTYWRNVSSEYSDTNLKTSFGGIMALKNRINLTVSATTSSGQNSYSSIDLSNGSLYLDASDIATILANKQLNLTSPNGVINVYGGSGVNFGTSNAGAITINSPHFTLSRNGSISINNEYEEAFAGSEPQWVSGKTYNVGDEVNVFQSNGSNYIETGYRCIRQHVSSNSNKPPADEDNYSGDNTYLTYWDFIVSTTNIITSQTYGINIDSTNASIRLYKEEQESGVITYSDYYELTPRKITFNRGGTGSEMYVNKLGMFLDDVHGTSKYTFDTLHSFDDLDIAAVNDLSLSGDTISFNGVQFGNTSISSVGDGSVTGAISSLDSNKSNVLRIETYSSASETVTASSYKDITVSNISVNNHTPIGIVECRVRNSSQVALLGYSIDSANGTATVRVKNLSTSDVSCYVTINVLYVHN